MIKILNIFLFLHIISIHSINKLIKKITKSILVQEKTAPKTKKIIHFYAHNKYCKKISGYIHISEKSTDTLNMKILLMLDRSFDDFALISPISPIKNEWQWHIQLKNKDDFVSPSYCFYSKKPSIEDEEIFGKQKLSFGKLYLVDFPKNNEEDFCNTSVILTHGNTSLTIPL